MKTQFDLTTERKADRYVDEHYAEDENDELFSEQVEVHLAFCEGRNSARESLEILARAVESIVTEGELGGSGTDADVASKAIAAVRERGDWPISEGK